MITLNEYIFEAQSVGELLTFDEFVDFFDNEDPEIVKDKIQKQFPNKTDAKIKVLTKYMTAWAADVSKYVSNIDDNILRVLYNQLCDMPISKLDKIIGSGEEACIFDLGDKILKLYYDKHIPAEKTKFFDICKENKYDIFPKVYKITKEYVIMEKLKVDTSKCKKYFDIIYNDTKHGDSIYHLVQDRTYDLSEMNDIETEVINWLELVRTACADVFDADIETNNNLGDLQVDNVGERNDGTIVYFDI